MKYVIFDIDGCISDDRHRAHLLPTHRDARNGDYDAYHEKLLEDKPINAEILDNFIDSDIDMSIVFVTARPQKFESRTRMWLKSHFKVFDYMLLMRPNDDYRRSPELKVALIEQANIPWNQICVAFDDRIDILEAYASKGACGIQELGLPVEPAMFGTPAILEEMAETFRERNKVYKNNYKICTEVMKALFPEGVPPEIAHSDPFGLFYMIIGKMTRFTESGCTHIDSIHDIAVYAAMIEANLTGRD